MGCYGMSQFINVVLSHIINLYCLSAATEFNTVNSALSMVAFCAYVY